MLTVDEYRHELWREVTERAQDHEIYDQEAFFETTCEILRDSEAITAFHPLQDGHAPSSRHRRIRSGRIRDGRIHRRHSLRRQIHTGRG